MALGVALGAVAPETAAKMGPLGDAFIKLIRMLIAPIIFCTVVALILGIHRLMSQGLTPTNLLGNAVAIIAMAKWEGALDEARLHKGLDEGS